MRVRACTLALGAVLVACGDSGGSSDPGVDGAANGPDGALGNDGSGNDAALADGSSFDGSTNDGGAIWKPPPKTSWQWQLSGTLDTSFDVAAYDIDLFTTTPGDIAALHGKQRKVICYFDTAYEPGRPDSTKLAPYKGNPVQGWPGQFWLDVRQPAVVTVMKDRIALAQQKGCDAVEADDVDSRTNDPGFPITANEQQSFIKTLAAEAHAHGMSYALKNDLDEVTVLLPFVDFAVNEECFAFTECALLKPFISAGKAVFQVEYTSGNLQTKGATICPGANALDFDTLIKHLELDAPRYSCR